ncbi:complex I subunit 5 family protein [Vulcanisaeta souniana]|uniref:F420H(2):quinone oxidoreductase n=1 Tax=Vulcanisaeta souniana JCM 11219 TaxID=1293586 RepID=A0A830DZW6_9CREN|nr:complex I subunit 5 family protein [Vulcanisaeta souniana]BDR91986.1 F420H(2):quinone oxidoreductase [Vulcanisaeta souniana JCM 11219]GGI68822.1 F420H(2):quinone oxidoreductase [Vulcanisaeta souniana JCM 11219]
MNLPIHSDPILIASLTLPFIASIIAGIIGRKYSKAAMVLTSVSFIPLFIYASYLLVLGGSYLVPLGGPLPRPLGMMYLMSDGLSNAFGLAIALVGITLEIASYPYMKHRFHVLELPEQFDVYYLLFTLCAASMELLIYAYNLLLMYIALEISLITPVILIYYYGYDTQGKTRRWIALLYFVYGMLASTLFLIGAVMVALENNTMDLAAVKNISLIAWALMFIGLLIKLPSFGPHVWIPWVHGSHPTPVAALISGLVGLMAYVLARLYLISPYFINEFRLPILIYAIIGGIIISLGVIRHQYHYKWLLAYSTAANSTYLLIGLALGTYGILGLTMHYISHLFGKTVLFMTAASIIVYYEEFDIRKMGGLQTYMPSVGAAAVLGWMALSGVLTLSLLAEFYLFLGLVNVVLPLYGLWVFLGLAVGLAIIFILTGYYGFWTLKQVFYGQPRGNYHKVNVDPKLVVPLYVLGLAAIILLFSPASTYLVHSILMGISTIMG